MDSQKPNQEESKLIEHEPGSLSDATMTLVKAEEKCIELSIENGHSVLMKSHQSNPEQSKHELQSLADSTITLGAEEEKCNDDPAQSTLPIHPGKNDIEKDTIHQIWLQGEEHLRENRPGMHQNVKRFREAHPGRHHLWSEEEIKSLITWEYPDLMETFTAYKHFICRVDLGKYIILYHYGGFYVDADTKLVKEFSGLLDICSQFGNHPVICRTDKSDYRVKLYRMVSWQKAFINNHFFYFPKAKNPFCRVLLDEAPLQKGWGMLEPRALYVLRVIGPGFVMRCIKKFQSKLTEAFDGIQIQRSSFVTTIEADCLDQFFIHQSQSTWLEDQGMHKMLQVSRQSPCFGACSSSVPVPDDPNDPM